MKLERLDSGFSLPELLVTVAILAIVLGGVATLFMGGIRVYSREVSGVTHQNDLAAAKNILLDDLSIAGFGVASGTNPVVVLDSNTDDTDSIEFLGDIDSDTEDATPGVVEKICYDVAGGVLRRSQQPSTGACGSGPDGWQPLASDVTEFNLSFFNVARTPIATDSNVTTAGLECWPSPVPIPTPGAGVVPTPLPNATCYVRVRLTAAETVRDQVVQKSLTGETAIRN